MRNRTNRFFCFTGILLLIASAFGGCRKADPIRRYKAPKDPTWRLLGAIIPKPDETWFFKIIGPDARVRPHREEFLRFLQSVEWKGPEAQWNLPQGWSEQRGSADRHATLRLSSVTPPLELSVTRLPGTAGGLLANVNRWRGQISLDPVTEKELDGQTRKLQVGGYSATLVDFEGPRKAMPMPPAAGTPPPSETPGGSMDEIRNLFVYDLPPDWTENPEPGPGRVFAFHAGDVRVTLTVLSDSAGGLAANINRWRGQVDLEPLEDAKAADLARPQSFLNHDGYFVDIAGKERAILCAFTVGPPFSIFLKMEGPAGDVRRQEAAFRKFAETLKTRKHG